jgi:hypothetical protein
LLNAIHEIAAIHLGLRQSPDQRKPASPPNVRANDTLIRFRLERAMTITEWPLARHGARDAAATHQRPATAVELVAPIALALSTLIAATAVSIGIARADAIDCLYASLAFLYP